jgi:hypothetical protein
LLSADFSAEAWRYRRPLILSQPGAIAEFVADATLYRNSAANLDDLRILRDGVEVPYVILTLAGARQTVERPAVIINKAWVPGVGVQAVLDLKGKSEHNRLRIATPLHNFKETVMVETSDDARDWDVVLKSGVIFDILQDEHAVAESTVSYPLSSRRFVRLTIPGWTDPAQLQAVWISAFNETSATRDTVGTFTPEAHEDLKTQSSELTVDFGFQGQPYDRVGLAVAPGLFSRSVEISSGNDRQHWFSPSGGVIFRTADDEQLSLETAERTERYLKITVFNADSAPLKFGPITVSGIRRTVRFPSSTAGSYAVYNGNAGARAPSYDFARVISSNAAASPAALGAAGPNPLFRPPERPWTDRNPWLLNGTLVAAVIAMGAISVRMLRKIKSPSP